MGWATSMTDRKKPGVAFWATVTLVVVVLYVASLGPAQWLSSNGWLPRWVDGPLSWVYFPLSWIYFNGPEPIHDMLDWYSDLWL